MEGKHSYVAGYAEWNPITVPCPDASNNAVISIE